MLVLLGFGIAIVGEKLGSIHPANLKLFYAWYGSSNVPLLIVVGCVYMELLLQSEWKLHWPG